ncbi:MAG: hypothetical protein JW751_02060 [Polyangiaceae bacterium]|nr:hypothetical protein [Polyangiaceae bacterium]
MRSERSRLRSGAGQVLALAVTLGTATASAIPGSVVFCNGRPTPARFFDGDTMSLAAGPFADRSVRVLDVNALESYGPVHQFGRASPRELLVSAKRATHLARRGGWHCSITRRHRDAYGRLLADCPDLGEALLRSGLGHAFSLDGPAPERLLAAQREAIVARRGMWAKGVPAILVTSVHSASERPWRRDAYHRLVSTTDGSSFLYRHRDRLRTCETVCVPQLALTPASQREVLGLLRAHPRAGPILADFDDRYLAPFLDEIATTGRVPRIVGPSVWGDLRNAIGPLRRRADIWRAVRAQRVCLTYVPMEFRYQDRPPCLTEP